MHSSCCSACPVVDVHFERVSSADREPAGAAEGQGEADEQPEGEGKVSAGRHLQH